MNEKALNRSYELAVADGYVGNLEEFVKRITDDQEALDRTYLLAVRDGFDGDLTSYSTIMGLSIPEVQTKEEVAVEEVKEVEEVVDDSVVQTRSELLNVVDSEEYKNEVADLSKEVEEVKTSVELKPLLYAFQPSIATGITATKSIIEDGFLKEYYVYDDLEKEARNIVAKQEKINPKDVTEEQWREKAKSIWIDKESKKILERKKEEILENYKDKEGSILDDGANVLSTYLKFSGIGVLEGLIIDQFRSRDYDKAVDKLQLSFAGAVDEKEKEAKRYNDQMVMISQDMQVLEEEINNIEAKDELTKEDAKALSSLQSNLDSTRKMYEDVSDKYSDVLVNLEDVSQTVDLAGRTYNNIDIVKNRVTGAVMDVIGGIGKLDNELSYKNLIQRTTGVDVTSEESKEMLPEFIRPIVDLVNIPNEIEKNMYLSLWEESEKLAQSTEKRQELGEIRSIEDFAEFTLDLFSEQAVNTAITASTGGTAGLLILSAGAAGNKMKDLDIQMEGVKDDSGNYIIPPKKISAAQYYGSAFLYGAAEYVTEKVALDQFNLTKKIFSKTPGLKNTIYSNRGYTYSNAFKNWGLNMNKEGMAEFAAQYGNNLTDKYILGEDISLTRGLKESYISGAMMSGLGFSAPVVMNDVYKAYSTKGTFQKARQNSEKIFSNTQEVKKLQKLRAENEGNSQVQSEIDEAIKAYVSESDNLSKENLRLKQESELLIDQLSDSPIQKQKLIDINNELHELRVEVDKVNSNNFLDQKTKENKIQQLKDIILKQESKKERIISTVKKKTFTAEAKKAKNIIKEIENTVKNGLTITILKAKNIDDAINKIDSTVEKAKISEKVVQEKMESDALSKKEAELKLREELKQDLLSAFNKAKNEDGLVHGFRAGSNKGMPVVVSLQDNSIMNTAGNMSVFSHEIGHASVFQKLLDKDADLIGLVEDLESYIKKRYNKAYKNFKEVEKTYSDKPVEEVAEEKLASLTDFMRQNDLKSDKTLRGRLLDKFRKINDNTGELSEIKTGEDVFNLLVSYTTSFKTGELQGLTKRLLEDKVDVKKKTKVAEKEVKTTDKKAQELKDIAKGLEEGDIVVEEKEEKPATKKAAKKPAVKKPKAKKAAKIGKPEPLKPLDKKETNAARGRYLNDFIGQSKDWLIDNIDTKNTDEWKKVDQDKKKAIKEFLEGKSRQKFSKSSFTSKELKEVNKISKDWIKEEKNNTIISRGLIGKLTEDAAELNQQELNDRLKLIDKVASSVSNIKFSKSKDVGPQINKLYEEMTSMWNDGGSDFTFQEIYKNKLLDELIGRRIDSFVLKGKPPGWTNESRADLINQTYLEFLPHIRNFNKAFHNYEKGAVENDNLFAWINSFMNEKVGNSFKKIGLKPEFDVDVTEAKAVTYEETEAQTEEREERDFSIRKKLGLNDEFKTKVFNKVKGVMGGRIPAVNSPEFKSRLEKEFERELFNTIREDVFGFQWQKRGGREVMPFNETKYDKFIRDNFLAMYEKLPLSTLSKMRSLKSGESLVKEVIDPNTGKQRRMTMQEAAMSGAKDIKAGNPVFEKFTPQELTDGEIFTEYFINPKIGRKSMRMEGLAKILAKEIAFDAVMEVVSDPAVFERMKDIYEIQDIDFIGNEIEIIGKQIDRNPNLKFSKSSSNIISKPIKNKFSEEGSISASLAIGYFINEKYKKIPFNKIETFDEFFNNFEKEFNKENYITKNGKKFDLKKKYKPLIYEYFVGKQFESILDKKGNKKFSVLQIDFKGFDKNGEGDLKIIENSTGKIANVEVKLDKKARFGSPNLFFEEDKIYLSEAQKELIPEDLFNNIVKITKEKGILSNLNFLIKEIGVDFTKLDKSGKKVKITPKQYEKIKSYKTNLLNIGGTETLNNKQLPIRGTVELGNSKVINEYYKRKNTDYIYIGNSGLYSLNDKFKLNAPELQGNQTIRAIVTPSDSNISKGESGAVRIRLFNEIKGLKPGLDYLNEKRNIYLLKNPEINKKVKKSTVENKIMLSKSKVVKPSASMTNQDVLSLAATVDAALENARNSNLPVKKIRVFDFDDTLAQTKSNVLYTMPDGKTGKLTAEEFAKKGNKLLNKGAQFDFSEFNKVVDGKKGPLFKVAEAIQKARGTEDVFILTARAAEAAPAIKEFLDSLGLNIPLENITGLGDSSPFAKSQWVVEKAAEGYNDFYFADDAYKNVRAVQDALSVIDVKSKVQQAHVKFSKSVDLNKTFNDIIEAKTGIPSEQTFDQLAKGIGRKKGKGKVFLPYSAEDFLGLIYPLISKGELGDAQLEFFNATLFKPFARAMNDVSRDRIQLSSDFKTIKNQLKDVPKNLRKEVMPGLTYENAVRIYAWDKQGIEVEGIDEKTIANVWEVMQENPELQAFADQLIQINKGDGYNYPGGDWLAGTITTDLYGGLNGTKRAKYLEEWQRNVDLMFTKENMLKLEAAYGPKYVEALKNILQRMKTGQNKAVGDRFDNKILNWINGSVGVTMFLNTRSAILQTISTINFLNWKDNNPLAAGKAFANQPQYWKDWYYLVTSDFMKDRRSGLRINVSESEIADAAKKGGVKGVINLLLQSGFAFTKAGDAFAIATGGATFYRNRVKTYEKQGLPTKKAEEKAFVDFQEITNESQQSARPDKISQQQSSTLGRLILAFANTPMQYNRIMKRSFQDIVNGRGDLKTNISKIAYYGFVQNIIFNALQSALFGMYFEDDEEDEKKQQQDQDKIAEISNGMLDSILRGMGYFGAAVSITKNFSVKLYKEIEKEKGFRNFSDVWIELAGIMPPIQAKIRRFSGSGKTLDYNWKEAKEQGFKFSLDNPNYLAAAGLVSGLTNFPVDRAFRKADNIYSAFTNDYESWQKIALLLGWNKWDLGIKDEKEAKSIDDKTKYKKVNFKDVKLKEVKYK